MALGLADPEFSSLLAARPHLFSGKTVAVSRAAVGEMRRIVEAVERVTLFPGFVERALSWAPEIARHVPLPRGIFFGYDFHLTTDGAKLIEVNTNAGGAYLNLLHEEKRSEYEQRYLEMFFDEWRAGGGNRELKTVAIVDEAPAGQYLYPEFLLFADLFARNGIDCVVIDAQALEFTGGRLLCGDTPIDLVYNRLTDFSFAREPALFAAYLAGVVVSPHPRAHALYADKRNLALLCDRDFLHDIGVDRETIDILIAGVPHTSLLDAENAETLWTGRKNLFFKPAHGFGARAAYRGDKMTKRVWEEVRKGEYVAQQYAAPGEIFVPDVMKYDVRNYVHRGEVFQLAARLYQGQTTNFRTEGGGFAQVRVD